MKRRTRIGALALVLAAAGSAVFAHRLNAAAPDATAKRERCKGAPVVDSGVARPALPGMRFFKVL